ncbi:MAG TPA: multiheme c-type cytochrome [Usitatibacteraceae bacterium]|nr:multiheme c-type cytochrome [Usitatibacteraceae bacterium]
MRRLLAAGLALAALLARAAETPPLPYEADAKHLGVVNCASSLCHGSISQWKGSNVLQNEYVTWSRVDKHALRANQVLWNERSKRIVANLGLKQPAHEAKICVDCHGHNPPAARQGERFKASDGVSCEACHGPAENWIKSHVAPGATHEGNVKDGLYPTDDPVALARLCLSCHFGNKDKFVTHRIMGAGHPRISFELDTFTQTQPPHFVVDEDWQKRKGRWDGVRVWAIGQALAAQEQLDVVLDPKRGRDGLFPELVVFDCHACHHPMSETRWKPRVGTRPGTIRFNDANLLMLRQIVRQTYPLESAAFNDLVLQLHRAVAGEGGDAMEAARKLRKGLDAVVGKLRDREFGDRDLRAILAGLVDDGLAGQFGDYAGAEQASMAIASVLNFLARRGALGDVRAANAALDRVFETVKDDEKYRLERFQAALGGLKTIVAR